jgi:hypothetical protein
MVRQGMSRLLPEDIIRGRHINPVASHPGFDPHAQDLVADRYADQHSLWDTPRIGKPQIDRWSLATSPGPTAVTASEARVSFVAYRYRLCNKRKAANRQFPFRHFLVD